MSQKAAKILSQTVELLECFLMMFVFVMNVCCPQLAAVQETQECNILKVSKLNFQPFLNVSAILMDFFFTLLMPEGRKGTILTVFLPGLCKPLSEVVNHSVAVGTNPADGQNQHFSNI